MGKCSWQTISFKQRFRLRTCADTSISKIVLTTIIAAISQIKAMSIPCTGFTKQRKNIEEE